MNIFELVTYVCITISSNGLYDHYSKTCNLNSTGELYSSEDKCSTVGKTKIGEKVHAFSITIGEDRRIENYKCVSRSVL